MSGCVVDLTLHLCAGFRLTDRPWVLIFIALRRCSTRAFERASRHPHARSDHSNALERLMKAVSLPLTYIAQLFICEELFFAACRRQAFCPLWRIPSQTVSSDTGNAQRRHASACHAIERDGLVARMCLATRHARFSCKKENMTHPSQKSQFMIRLADQPEDPQRIADLFLKYPDQGTRSTGGIQMTEHETIVIFDASRKLAGTCELAITADPFEQFTRLNETVMDEEDDGGKKLVVSNICVTSREAEEVLRLFTLHVGWMLAPSGVTGILRMHVQIPSSLVTLQRAGYVLLPIFDHHRAPLLASYLPLMAYPAALAEAEQGKKSGQMPSYRPQGLLPFEQATSAGIDALRQFFGSSRIWTKDRQ